MNNYDTSFCCLCKSNKYKRIVRGPIVQIIRCGNCGLMRQSSLKRNSGYSFTSYAGSSDRYDRQRKDKERIQIQDFKRIIHQLDEFKPDKGKLLEVGCAMGTTLNEFRKAGWNVTGVEPDEWTFNEAKRKYGLNVINKTFQNAGLKEESYDIIIMLHVIEHLSDPFEGLKYLYRLLKPHGILVLETPRYDTLTFMILKGRERSVIPGHLYYFTRRTISSMAKESGFDTILLDSVGRTVTLDRIFFYAAKFMDSKAVTKYLASLSDSLHLDKIKLHINLNDMMRVYLQRPLQLQ